MRSASTIIATAARCSRAFKSGLVRLRNEDDPTRWTEGYDFPAVSDGRVVRRSLPLETSRRHVGARLQHATSVVRRSARARGADQAVRFRMGEPHALSRPICAHARAISRARSSASHGQPADAPSASCSRPSRPGQARDHGRELRSSGERRHRREPRGAARGATAARSRPGISSRTASSSMPRPASPSRFEILAATRAQERLLLTYAAGLETGRNRGAESVKLIRPNISGANRPTIST